MKFFIEAPQQAAWITGTDRIGFNVLRHLQEIDRQNRYCVICNPDFRYTCSVISASNFEVLHRRRRSRASTILAMPAAAMRLLGRRYLAPVDAFCSFHNMSSAPIKYAPTISFALDLIPLHFPDWYHSSLPSRRNYEHRLDRAKRNVDRFLAISEHTKSDLVSHLGIPSDKIHVAYLAADDNFRPVTDPHLLSRVRDRYGLPSRFILTAGSNEPRKNVRTVIDAFSRLPISLRDRCPLVVMGPLWGKRASDVETFGNGSTVRYIGEVEESHLPSIYSLSSAFIFLSLYEGFGLPALEAMTCGAPVLASSTSSIPEVVGEAGILVHPEDVDAITTGLEQIMTDDALIERLSALGIDQAAGFDWRSTTQVVFDSLMEVSGSRLHS